MKDVEQNPYGIIRDMKHTAAMDLAQQMLALTKKEDLLRFGHDRWHKIDDIMLKDMGRNVRDYWAAQSMVYKSILRRDIWERALILVKKDGMRKSNRQTQRQSTSVESLLESVRERA